jgi:hypothetical protein
MLASSCGNTDAEVAVLLQRASWLVMGRGEMGNGGLASGGVGWESDGLACSVTRILGLLTDPRKSFALLKAENSLFLPLTQVF